MVSLLMQGMRSAFAADSTELFFRAARSTLATPPCSIEFQHSTLQHANVGEYSSKEDERKRRVCIAFSHLTWCALFLLGLLGTVGLRRDADRMDVRDGLSTTHIMCAGNATT